MVTCSIASIPVHVWRKPLHHSIHFIQCMVGILILLNLGMFQCSGSSEELIIDRSMETKPDWITEIPEDETYLYFLGISDRLSKEMDAQKEAIDDAMNNMRQFMGLKVESMFEKIYEITELEAGTSEFVDEMHTSFISTTETEIEGSIHRYSYWELHQDPETTKQTFHYYVLIGLPKDRIKESIEVFLFNQDQGSLSLIEKQALELLSANVDYLVDEEEIPWITPERTEQLQNHSISIHAQGTCASNPSITAYSKGFGIAWSDCMHGVYSIYFALLNEAGQVASPVQTLSTLDTHDYHPQVYWNGREFVVVWFSQVEQGYAIYFARLDSFGSLVQAPILLSGENSLDSYPQLIWTGLHYGLVWIKHTTAGAALYFIRLDELGNPVTNPRKLHQAKGLITGFTMVWTQSLYSVLWQEGENEETQTLHLLQLSENGLTTGPALPFLEEPRPLYHFDALFKDEKFIIAWSEKQEHDTPENDTPENNTPFIIGKMAVWNPTEESNFISEPFVFSESLHPTSRFAIEEVNAQKLGIVYSEIHDDTSQILFAAWEDTGFDEFSSVMLEPITITTGSQINVDPVFTLFHDLMGISWRQQTEEKGWSLFFTSG